jgi:hypothetical protein
MAIKLMPIEDHKSGINNPWIFVSLSSQIQQTE